jgi:hypothetical protein
MLNELLPYLTSYWQPLSALFIGVVILIFVGYMNWYRTVKTDTIRWIARRIYRDKCRSEASADGLFMVATSFLLLIGGTWVVGALVYLGLI